MSLKHLFQILLYLFVTSANAQSDVRQYTRYTGYGQFNREDLIVLRRFQQNGQLQYLTVNCTTLETRIVPATALQVQTASWETLKKQFKDTPYLKALQYASSQSFSLQDAGIIHGYPKEKGITLTIDLCPSHKPLDRNIFTDLIAAFGTIEKPVPVALSLSGHFLENHRDDIGWLQQLEKNNAIRITWVNHTYSHFYDPKFPLQENFLLKPGTDINFEILQNEVVMLEQGLIPSVFFRFPGLVSDNKVVGLVTDYGLIPIGSDAWLAKGQSATSGSIVLIHGNGNEPVGVSDFIRLLKNEKNAVLEKQWLLYDLSNSIGSEFKN
ncbi:MAG TPA: polysaccharide deacetylase [Flavobacterium sp.]|nr:polysaccharide deacetylase [Flavobacterium sp.]